jgi:hypothetical protein
VSESADRPVLPQDLAGTVPHAGVDPTLKGRALQDTLRRAIATRRGSCSWDVDHTSWVVTLHPPEEHDFFGKTLEEALTWCLVWLMASEQGVGLFLV